MSRILHILSQIPSQTGSGVFLNNLITQCHQAGHGQAAVIGLPENLREYPLPHIHREHIAEVLFETDLLPFKIPGMSDVMPYESTIFSSMDQKAFEAYKEAFTREIKGLVEKFRPDVVISNHLWVVTAIAVSVVTRITEETRPKIYTVCHGTDLRQMQLSPALGPYAAAGCAEVDGVFSLNTYQSDVIHKLYGIEKDRIHIIGAGYDNTIFFNNEDVKAGKNQKTELVYAGKLSYAKGLKELILSMQLLDPARFRLTIAGKGSGAEADEILRQMKASKADIRYVGQLSQNELANLFRTSDIFVLPSYYEGLPLVIIEAMACGLKVVVNELNGLRDWLGDPINTSGRIRYVPMPRLLGPDTCDPDAVTAYTESLATAIRHCSKTSHKDMAPVPLYRQAIEDRSWENVFKRMERILDQNKP